MLKPPEPQRIAIQVFLYTGPAYAPQGNGQPTAPSFASSWVTLRSRRVIRSSRERSSLLLRNFIHFIVTEQ